MRRFTTEFGMGSGGSNALWSSSNSVGESWLSASPNWVCDVLVVAVLANFRLYRLYLSHRLERKLQIVWVLYGQASRAISIG